MQNDFRQTGDVNWNRVMKFLGGGAMVGGGIASTIALYKFLSRLNDKKDSASSTSYDDDVMYINLPEKEAHTKEASNPDTALMSYMGMVLAGYLGYKGVTSVFNKVRENQLQTELDQAQNVYLDRLSGGPLGKEAGIIEEPEEDLEEKERRLIEILNALNKTELDVPALELGHDGGQITLEELEELVNSSPVADENAGPYPRREGEYGGEGYEEVLSRFKEASTKEAFSSGDKWGAGMMGVPLIIALMSAVMANKLLSKSRPPLKRQGAKEKIKKLVVRRNKENSPEVPFDEEIDMEPTGEDLEGLMRTTMAKESRAVASGYADLITKVANGGLSEFKDLVREYGFNDSLDMIKGARFEKASELKKSLAVSLVCHDPLISEPLGISLASEYHDMGPGICKAASNLGETLSAGLVYVGRQFLKKYAAEMYEPLHRKFEEKYSTESLKEEIVKSAIDISDIALLKKLLEPDPDSEELQEEETSTNLQVSKSKDSTDPDISLEEDPFLESDNSEEAREFIEANGDVIDSMLQTG